MISTWTVLAHKKVRKYDNKNIEKIIYKLWSQRHITIGSLEELLFRAFCILNFVSLDIQQKRIMVRAVYLHIYSKQTKNHF